MNCSKNEVKPRLANGRGGSQYGLITPELKPFIFVAFIKGYSTQYIANLLLDKYKIKITRVSVWQFKDAHKEEYEEFRKEWLADLKEIPLANAKCRIVELQKTYRKLSKKINEIIETVPLSQWDRINLSGLIREANKILEQLQDESGDKVQRFKGEGGIGPFVFGDMIINQFADGVLGVRKEETVDLRNRLTEDRLLDTRNLISKL